MNQDFFFFFRKIAPMERQRKGGGREEEVMTGQEEKREKRSKKGSSERALCRSGWRWASLTPADHTGCSGAPDLLLISAAESLLPQDFSVFLSSRPWSDGAPSQLRSWCWRKPFPESKQKPRKPTAQWGDACGDQPVAALEWKVCQAPS